MTILPPCSVEAEQPPVRSGRLGVLFGGVIEADDDLVAAGGDDHGDDDGDDGVDHVAEAVAADVHGQSQQAGGGGRGVQVGQAGRPATPPMTAAYRGFFSFRLTPQQSGSVMPIRAVKPEDRDSSFRFLDRCAGPPSEKRCPVQCWKPAYQVPERRRSPALRTGWSEWAQSSSAYRS